MRDWLLVKDTKPFAKRIFLFFKQIVHSHLLLNVVGPGVRFQAVGGNHHGAHAFAGFGARLENAHSVAQFKVVFLGQFKLALREFHLTQVYDFIIAVNKHIHLCASLVLVFRAVNPRVHVADNSRYA